MACCITEAQIQAYEIVCVELQLLSTRIGNHIIRNVWNSVYMLPAMRAGRLQKALCFDEADLPILENSKNDAVNA